MNPPFANEMDLRHTALAYNMLKPNGKIVSLVAENSIYYKRRVTEEFNEAITKLGFSITEIPHGSFRESGTNVDVVTLEATKIGNTQIILT